MCFHLAILSYNPRRQRRTLPRKSKPIQYPYSSKFRSWKPNLRRFLRARMRLSSFLFEVWKWWNSLFLGFSYSSKKNACWHEVQSDRMYEPQLLKARVAHLRPLSLSPFFSSLWPTQKFQFAVQIEILYLANWNFWVFSRKSLFLTNHPVLQAL